jgi:hypothetical protein
VFEPVDEDLIGLIPQDYKRGIVARAQSSLSPGGRLNVTLRSLAAMPQAALVYGFPARSYRFPILPPDLASILDWLTRLSGALGRP